MQQLTLVISNTNKMTHIAKIWHVFKYYGRINMIRATEHYFYVEYDDLRDAHDALKACNGMMIDGDRVSVSILDLNLDSNSNSNSENDDNTNNNTT